VVSPPGGIYEVERMATEERLTQADIPVYSSFERAARALANVTRYWRFREEAKTQPPG